MMTPTNPEAPRPEGGHWSELTATLPPEQTDEFSQWLTCELETMEDRLAVYVTANSLHRSLRR